MTYILKNKLNNIIVPIIRVLNYQSIVFFIFLVSHIIFLIVIHFTSNYSNNYSIFFHSFSNLISNQNLYILYPDLYGDLFKYTPTFALFMGAFHLIPKAFGYFLWLFLNYIFLLYFFFQFNKRFKFSNLYLYFLLFEIMINQAYGQSNGLMAGLLLGCLYFLEKKKPIFYAICLCSTVFIKLYGILFIILLLFYPKKFIHNSIITIIVFLGFLFLPLVFIPFEALVWQYKEYISLLIIDNSQSTGLSLMGILNFIFPNAMIKNQYVQLFGLVLFIILPVFFYFFRKYKNKKLIYLYTCSLFVWLIMFNHKSESPSYIIAVTGCFLWLVSQYQHLNIFKKVGFGIGIFFISLYPSDLFLWLHSYMYLPFIVHKAIPILIFQFFILKEVLEAVTELFLPALRAQVIL